MIKIERLEDGIRFRAWACRAKVREGYGLIAERPRLGEYWGWVDDGSLDSGLSVDCSVGKALLAEIELGTKRRVEITVRFV